jgi:GalNAc-alpha-(1->4)-GalNAc-alpha-(1->3)-diNAcBac-PP-undecaprenol alpha-1,4-N-acetyl-D-galactosaminyltransferase
MSATVLFVISELNAGGGAARALVTLANEWARSDAVRVFVLTHVEGSTFPLSDRVRHLSLLARTEVRRNLWNKIQRRLTYWPRLLTAITRVRPDVTVGVIRGMNWRVVAASRLLGVPTIAWEHTNHTSECGLWSWIERRLIYRLADALVVLNSFDGRFYESYLRNVHVIPNALSMRPSPHGNSRVKRVLAVGDLDRWWIKGFDLLLEAFATVARTHSEWRLALAGGGELGKAHLQNLAASLGVAEKVDFLGFSSTVEQEMQRSEIFALSSRYEGFSLALLEAMSQGCAIVSFDCEAGPRDFVEHNVNGLLVPAERVSALAEGLDRLMSDPAARECLAGGAVRSCRQFCPSRIAACWSELLGTVHS